MRPVLVLAITVALVARASAHVAPSVDDNNRYIKLTPLGDRVRVAYTVFFGEVPGAQTRPSIDADHDGAISDAEAQAFGGKLAAEVAAALDLSVDATQHPVAWSEVVVGMGSPTVRAGSFSVDLVTYLCLPTVRGRHTVLLRDRFRIPRPGETELKVEDSPGVSVDHARIGQAEDPSHDYRFVGPGGPLSDDGLDLVFTASDKAPLGDASCKAAAPASPQHGVPTGLLVGAAAVLGFVLAAIVTVVRRRRARRPG
jgi:hypothetical protein